MWEVPGDRRHLDRYGSLAREVALLAATIPPTMSGTSGRFWWRS